MKLLFAVLLLSAAYAGPASLQGKWKVNTSAAGRENEQQCNFVQKEEELTGTCRSERGTVEINGKVTGQKVTWTYKSDSEGGPVTVVFKGNVSDTKKITGSILAVEFAVEGEFVATPAN